MKRGIVMIKKGLSILLSVTLVLLSPGIESHQAWAQVSFGNAGGAAFGPGRWTPSAVRELFKGLNAQSYAGLQIQGVEIDKAISYFKDLDFESPSNQNAALPVLESFQFQQVKNLEDYFKKQSEGKEDVFLKAMDAAVGKVRAEADAVIPEVEKGEIQVKDLTKTAERADVLADRTVYLPPGLQERVLSAQKSMSHLRQMRILNHAEAMARALEHKTLADFLSGVAAETGTEFSGEKTVSWIVGSRAEQILGEDVPGIQLSPERLEENAVDAGEILLDARSFLKKETIGLLAAVFSGLTDQLEEHQARVRESRYRVREIVEADVSRKASEPIEVKGGLKPASILYLALVPASLLLSLKFETLGFLAAINLASFFLNEFLVLRHVNEKIKTREAGLDPEKFHKAPDPGEPVSPLWLTGSLVFSMVGSGLVSALAAKIVSQSLSPTFVFNGQVFYMAYKGMMSPYLAQAFVFATLVLSFVLPLFLFYFLRLRLFFSMGLKEEILEKAWEIWDETRYYMDSDPSLGPSTRRSKAEDWRNVLVFLHNLPDSKNMEKSLVEMILRSMKSSLQDYENYVESDSRLSAREKKARMDAVQRLTQRVWGYLNTVSQ